MAAWRRGCAWAACCGSAGPGRRLGDEAARRRRGGGDGGGEGGGLTRRPPGESDWSAVGGTAYLRGETAYSLLAGEGRDEADDGNGDGGDGDGGGDDDGGLESGNRASRAGQW